MVGRNGMEATHSVTNATSGDVACVLLVNRTINFRPFVQQTSGRLRQTVGSSFWSFVPETSGHSFKLLVVRKLLVVHSLLVVRKLLVVRELLVVCELLVVRELLIILELLVVVIFQSFVPKASGDSCHDLPVICGITYWHSVL